MKRLTNAQLETEFNTMLLRAASPVERAFVSTHPDIRLYLLLWFMRGYDAANGHYTHLINTYLTQELNDGSTP